ncbi:MAG: hypothetical protein PVI88_00275 [Nitrosopumilaceae archaeon]|jgi:hypothetical protein
MAWDRYTKITVTNEGTGLVISDLDIDFDINRSITLAENTAELTVYNAQETTRKQVLKKGATIVFEAGYKDESVATIFAGSITKSNSYKNGNDVITEIKAVAGRGSNISLKNIDISISYSAGTFLSRPIRDIAALMGLVIHGIETANIKLPNGWVFAGSVNGALRYIHDVLSSSGINMYIDNNELVIHNVTGTSRFNIVLLSYEGGLLKIEDITEAENQSSTSKNKSKEVKKKLKFDSLLISQLQINCPVTFRTENLNATYIVEKLRFFGNNYGGDFNCEGEVIEQ